MKTMLRITLSPLMLTLRLMLGLAAFVTSIASSVINLTVSVLTVLGVASFCAGYDLNGFIFLGFAFLASPIGLPMIANLLLSLCDHILGFFEGLLC